MVKTSLTKKNPAIKNVMVGGRPTDIVIPVMGPTGVGKSTFINILLGKVVMPVGHHLSSRTSTLQYAIVDNPSTRKLEGRRVIILDTPGSDTEDGVAENLKDIANWLKLSYDADMKLGGVICLLSIADKRRKDKNFDKLHQLFGDQKFSRVVLGTTNWGKVDKNVGVQNEQQYMTFGNTITASGSKLLRFDMKQESAVVFVDTILDRLKSAEDDENLRTPKEPHRENPKKATRRNTPKQHEKVWKKKGSMIKADDNVMDGLPTDIVIPVMGPTGVGKSTFINTLLGENIMKVGHDITSCTSTLQYEVVDNPSTRKLEGRRVIIVDTPGFDDTYEDDVEILRRIAVWLASSYNDKMTLGGVIYLQSIAEPRLKGAALRNLDMFHQLCGDKALARVVLGTTNWGEIEGDVGEEREQQLAKIFWKTMIASGSKSLRFDITEGSARTFLDAILDQLESAEDNVLRIQNELVELERRIPETDAGKELRYTLKQVLKMQEEGDDPKTAAPLLESLKKQIGELRISLPRKFYLKFFG